MGPVLPSLITFLYSIDDTSSVNTLPDVICILAPLNIAFHVGSGFLILTCAACLKVAVLPEWSVLVGSDLFTSNELPKTAV